MMKYPMLLGRFVLLAVTLTLALYVAPKWVWAAGTVGAGTPASCTDAALDTALTEGGLVTFNCGGAAMIDISVGAGGSGMKMITSDTTIDGGTDLITISGGNTVRVLTVVSGVSLSIRNVTIANGVSADIGGGIHNSGALTVDSCTFVGNGATMNGGAIYNDGLLTIQGSTFSGNHADVYGGGVFNILNSNTMTVVNSTFSGNSALVGGGIYNAAPLLVTNCTFVSNDAQAHGAGLENIGSESTTATLRNTLFAANTGGNCFNDALASIVDGGHNLDDAGTCGFSPVTGSLSNTNPELDPAGLKDNGGRTQTIALCGATGPSWCVGVSPAIGAGDETICATTTGLAPVNNLDQRGFARPGIGSTDCSIGAFEFAGIPVVPTGTPTMVAPTPTTTEAMAVTQTPTRTPTAKAMPSSTVTVTPSITPTVATVLVGDCTGTGLVTVADIVVLVNITLGNTAASACEQGIPPGAEVNVALIIQAVNNALKA